jgi:hypothetical protein
MIRFSAAPAFDFDEWADLHARDRAAFEARRRALLAITLARGGRRAAAGRAMLERLEAQLAGRTDAERARLALLATAASARQMTERLAELGVRLRQLGDAVAQVRPHR